MVLKFRCMVYSRWYTSMKILKTTVSVIPPESWAFEPGRRILVVVSFFGLNGNTTLSV